MSKRYYPWLLVSLWLPALCAGMFFLFLSAYQQIHLDVEGFIEIATLLVTLAGLTIAILIGVYTAIYVQSRSKRESGFNMFFASLNDFTELTRNLHFHLRQKMPQKPRGYDDWCKESGALMDRLHSLKPAWEGYEADCGLEKQMGEYARRFEKLCDSAGPDFLLSIYPTRHDRLLKAALLGLLTMEEAIEGQKLSMRLTWLLPSFAFLLALCFIVRIVAELGLDLVNSQVGSNINLALTSSLSSALIVHIVMSMLVIYHWQKQVWIRDRAWATVDSSPANMQTQQASESK